MVEAVASTTVSTDETNNQHFSVLPDPIPDRTLDDATCPRMINKPMEDSAIWGDNDLPNWRVIKDFLTREGPITKPQIMRLIRSAL